MVDDDDQLAGDGDQRQLLGLALPSTFPQFHDLSWGKSTWVHPSGSLHRIDFIGIPIPWLAGSHNPTSTVRSDLDFTTVRCDHFLVHVGVSIPPLQYHPLPVRRRIACDRDRLRDPEVIQAISNSIDQLPKIPWSVEPSSHLHLLNDQVCQFTRWFPRLLCQHHRNITGKITLFAILARGHLDIYIEVDRQLLSLLKARK